MQIRTNIDILSYKIGITLIPFTFYSEYKYVLDIQLLCFSVWIFFKKNEMYKKAGKLPIDENNDKNKIKY